MKFPQKIEFIKYFSPKYTVRVSTDHEDEYIYFAFPGCLQGIMYDEIIFIFYPENMIPWYGTFTTGFISGNSITIGIDMPGGEKALIIRRGLGYIVNVFLPSDCIELKIEPIMGYIVDVENEAIIIWDYERFYRVNPQGVVWKSNMVSLGDIENVQIIDGKVNAEVRRPGFRKLQNVSIDIESGASFPKGYSS